MTISLQQIKALRHAYENGLSRIAAAMAAECSVPTANRKFALFEAQGIARPPGAPRRRRTPAKGRRFYDCPVYTGPAIIGKAITAPTQPSGPGWIG